MIISLQGKMFQFCGKNCSDEYKKINNVMAMCEYCKIEKIVKETVRFSGADKSFCSEGKGKIILLLIMLILLKVTDGLSCYCLSISSLSFVYNNKAFCLHLVCFFLLS